MNLGYSRRRRRSAGPCVCLPHGLTLIRVRRRPGARHGREQAMTAQNAPANLRKLALAVGLALGFVIGTGTAPIDASNPKLGAGTARFVDHGGPVLSAAQVYLIYWGRAWTATGTVLPSTRPDHGRDHHAHPRAVPERAGPIPRHQAGRPTWVNCCHQLRPAARLYRRTSRRLPRHPTRRRRRA